MCFVVTFVVVVVATRRLTVENRTTTQRRTALYCSLLYYRSVGSLLRYTTVTVLTSPLSTVLHGGRWSFTSLPIIMKLIVTNHKEGYLEGGW